MKLALEKKGEYKDWLPMKTTRVRQATNKTNKMKHQTGVQWETAWAGLQQHMSNTMLQKVKNKIRA